MGVVLCYWKIGDTCRTPHLILLFVFGIFSIFSINDNTKANSPSIQKTDRTAGI
jgi:hypothetical protein